MASIKNTKMNFLSMSSYSHQFLHNKFYFLYMSKLLLGAMTLYLTREKGGGGEGETDFLFSSLTCLCTPKKLLKGREEYAPLTLSTINIHIHQMSSGGVKFSIHTCLR